MIDTLKNQLPDYAKDLKLNLGSVLTATSELSDQQIAGVALSVAYATKNQLLIDTFSNYASTVLDDVHVAAVKGAVAIMGMNNIYYRFLHLVHDENYSKMPAGLRMNIMMNPGIDKKDFELFSLAVSAINGCGMCMESHTKVLEKAGVSKNAIQHAIRIAAVLNGIAQVCVIEEAAK